MEAGQEGLKLIAGQSVGTETIRCDNSQAYCYNMSANAAVLIDIVKDNRLSRVGMRSPTERHALNTKEQLGQAADSTISMRSIWMMTRSTALFEQSTSAYVELDKL
ncbi:hypothetical protein OSTOST_24830 [Ostertagia ostertagi]